MKWIIERLQSVFYYYDELGAYWPAENMELSAFKLASWRTM